MEYWWSLLHVIFFWELTRVPLCYCLVRQKLPVLWIMPLSGAPGKGNITAEVLPAVELALQHLSEQTSNLANYELQFHLTDSECDNSKALKAFFETIFSGPKPLMIFGGACSSVTSVLAQSLESWNLVQLSFAVTVPLLADKRRFPNFFRTVPSDSAVNVALVRFLRQYGWSRVGTLTQREQSFTEVQTDLNRHLEEANIQLAEAESFSEAPCDCVKKLKIYNVKMYGQKYQWILPEWVQSSRWTDIDSTNCTSENILTAIEGSISADIESLSSSHIRGISGRTPQEYEKEYNERRQMKQLGGSKFHGFAYDGTWVIAKALTRVMETVKYRERYSVHRNFTLTDQEVGQMILEAMDKINFFGVTGHVMFQKGERVANVKFAQYQDGKAVDIEKYSAITDELEFISPIRFHKDKPTKDRTHVYPHRKRISILLYAIVSFLTFLGIFTACIFLVFSLKHRSHWAISMSRPLMNSLIILGAVLSYSSIFFMGLDGSYVSDRVFEVSCTVQISCLSIGCTTAFGAMFAKIWQIHLFFKNHSIDKKNTKNYGPNLLVILLFLIDLSLLISLQVLDPFRRTVKEYRIQPHPHGQDFFIQPFSERCENTHGLFWMAAFYIYKGTLLLSTCFLAWSTRHMNIPAVNDSRSIRFSVFVSVPVILIGTCASMFWQHRPNVQFCIVTLVIVTCCCCTLCMVFVPKIIIIRMGPDPAFLSRRFHLKQWHSELEKETEQNKDKRCMLEQRDPGLSVFMIDATLSISSSLTIHQSENLYLRRHINYLDSELEDLTRQLNLNETSAHAMEKVIVTGFVHKTAKDKCLTLPESSRCDRNLHQDINSPEHVRRRLSLQLPILHHAYLPSVGGVMEDSSPLYSPLQTPTTGSYGLLLTGL
ncbi:gamma-aminobutyric acid type B receptor subunit 2 isoform X2 [Danio rerio]|uniref:Gamma-aminobutyric acid type B receptor subunit 2 isoform X2 n=1 Tax=Danio rerio TaxID=7955 RepID=A0A8M9NZR0_DANRE|nr:gamma-aminobutyric acid type B receptor subunit 2-like isoform X2 [Danio rerio]|eukprot:XP_021322612.1 gamma-aminobutyric acid type B receptor subunit 2-like isoform X2 [Danio rerio]